MQVAQPIRDPNGRTLLEKGAVLTDDLVARLKKFGVVQIDIEGTVAAGDLTAGTVRDMLDGLSEEYPVRTPFGCAVELRAHGMPALEYLTKFLERPEPHKIPAALRLVGSVAHIFSDATLSDFLPVLDLEGALTDEDAEVDVAGAGLPGLDPHDPKVRDEVASVSVDILSGFLEHADERVRLAAAEGLEFFVPRPEQPLRERRSSLTSALDDPNADVVLSCALGLENDAGCLDESGRQRIGEAYMQVLTESQHPRRYLAVLGLGRLDVPGARAILLEMLEDETISIKRSALYALGDLREQRALQPAMDLALDEDDGARAWACRCLGRVGDPVALPSLITGLHDPVEHVARQAADALIALGDRAESALVGTLTDPDWSIRADVCRILGEVGGLRSLPALKIRAGTDPHRFVREAAGAAVEAILARQKAAAEAPPSEGIRLD
ncbi:MAG: hypothetical protein FJX76_01865 [Armatimonadetes bacterium]|nr:hypothetical protein [Armatimonadota bacterium]